MNEIYQSSVELELMRSVGMDERFAIDVGSVRRGHRVLGLLHLEACRAERIRDGLQLLGLKVVATRFLTRESDPTSRESLLKATRLAPLGNVSASHEWAEIWFSRLGVDVPGADELFDDPGQFLGYPPCCVRSFQRIVGLSTHYRRYLFDAPLRHWELNRLTALFGRSLLMPDFFPCSLGCAAALRFCRLLLGAAEEVLGPVRLVDWIDLARQPIVIMGGSICTFAEWRLAGTCLEVSVSSGSKVPLDAVGSGLPSQAPDSPWLVPFTHLADPTRGFLPTKLSLLSKTGSAALFDLRSSLMSGDFEGGAQEC